MLQGMDQSKFGEFVAALWERQGWQTQLKRKDGRVFVALQRPESGDEGLLWAIAGDAEIGGKQVQQFASICKNFGVDEGAIVTAGTLSDHAKKVSDESGIRLVDGDSVKQIVKRNELTDLVKEYADGSGGGGSDSSGDSPLDQLSEVADTASELVSNVVGDADVPDSVPVKPVAVVLVVVALLGVGVLVGPSLPFLGGGGGGISAESASPANSTASLQVEWNAKVVDSIDPNVSDGKAYYPPDGKQFVLVRLSINNTGQQKITLSQSAFKFRANGTTYSHQTFADHDGFLDFPASPGQHYIGWTAFTVPEGTSGTIIYDQSVTGGSVAVTFQRDSSLPVKVAQKS